KRSIAGLRWTTSSRATTSRRCSRRFSYRRLRARVPGRPRRRREQRNARCSGRDELATKKFSGRGRQDRGQDMFGRFTSRRVSAPDLVPGPDPVATPALDISEPAPAPEPVADAAARPNPLLSDKLLDAKVRLHRRLIEEINLSVLEKMPDDEVRHHVHALVSQYTLADRLALNAQELEDFVTEILDEMTGLGPIEPLLKDPMVNDILINGHEQVYVERAGVLEPTLVRFKDETHLLRIVNKIVSAVGRRVDESQPL